MKLGGAYHQNPRLLTARTSGLSTSILVIYAFFKPVNRDFRIIKFGGAYLMLTNLRHAKLDD